MRGEDAGDPRFNPQHQKKEKWFLIGRTRLYKNYINYLFSRK
jgi:hypothetical protein